MKSPKLKLDFNEEVLESKDGEWSLCAEMVEDFFGIELDDSAKYRIFISKKKKPQYKKLKIRIEYAYVEVKAGEWTTVEVPMNVEDKYCDYKKVWVAIQKVA